MRKRKIQLYMLALFVAGVIAFVLGEVAIRLFAPTEFLHPRNQFSSEYGLIPFANANMVHGVPGKWEFHYRTNADHCRGGQALAPEDVTGSSVVVLGDSYAFGMGVNDGEEFPTVMSDNLGDDVHVLNLASPGWGLTQQIRRFYTYGNGFAPDVVVLQFCGNDPEDNFIYRVTEIVNDEFVYRDSALSFNWSKKYLSRSVIQRSQLYNFFRARAARAVQSRFVRQGESAYDEERAETDTVSPQELLYCDLLDLFARDLTNTGIRLVIISVDRQLDGYPHIRTRVDDLAAAGQLQYIEVLDWLQDEGNYRSLEGHIWGARAHAIIGRELARMIRNDSIENPPAD